MAKLESKSGARNYSGDIFERGKHQVSNITVGTSHIAKPPVELFTVAPLEEGTYPVLLFCHGFLLTSTWYTNLLHHIASHGYIVVAPKSYGLTGISSTEEVNMVAKVTEWLSTGLPLILPQTVASDVENLALAGHSRGGNTAFALALGRTSEKSSKKKTKNNTPPYKFKAIIGVDPVAGFTPLIQTSPKILKYIPRCFNMSIPVAVIGTGYGNQAKGLIPPFATDGVSHAEFFSESRPPACYFLAREYGHVDMMDDSAVNWLKYVCKSGDGSKEAMRRSVGGIVVAFLRCYLGSDDKDLIGIVNDPTGAPIVLDPVIYVKE